MLAIRRSCVACLRSRDPVQRRQRAQGEPPRDTRHFSSSVLLAARQPATMTEEKEPERTVAEPVVLTKYKMAAEIVNRECESAYVVDRVGADAARESRVLLHVRTFPSTFRPSSPRRRSPTLTFNYCAVLARPNSGVFCERSFDPNLKSDGCAFACRRVLPRRVFVFGSILKRKLDILGL